MGNEKSGNEAVEPKTYWRVRTDLGTIKEVSAKTKQAEEACPFVWVRDSRRYFNSETEAVEFVLEKYHTDVFKVEENFKREHRLAKQRLERFKKKYGVK